MIIEDHTTFNTFGSFNESSNFFNDTVEFNGDACEFAELTATALTEMHNLTVALARVEYKSLTESNTALLNEGVREYLVRAGATIKEWWNKFVAWLGSLYTRLKDVFVKRGDWLARNKGNIDKATDAQLAAIKGNVGEHVLGTDFAGSAKAAVDAANRLIGDAQTVATSDQAKTFRQRATDVLKNALKNRIANASLSQAIQGSLVGEAKEVSLDRGMVGKMISVAENTFKAVDQMKGAKMVAASAIKQAEGMTRVEGGDQAAINARIGALREVGPMVQATIAAYSSAIGTANGQVMPLLVRAAKAGGGAAAAPAATNESSLLSSFM